MLKKESSVVNIQQYNWVRVTYQALCQFLEQKRTNQQQKSSSPLQLIRSCRRRLQCEKLVSICIKLDSDKYYGRQIYQWGKIANFGGWEFHIYKSCPGKLQWSWIKGQSLERGEEIVQCGYPVEAHSRCNYEVGRCPVCSNHTKKASVVIGEWMQRGVGGGKFRGDGGEVKIIWDLVGYCQFFGFYSKWNHWKVSSRVVTWPDFNKITLPLLRIDGSGLKAEAGD